MRIDRAADDLNPFLLVLAIGLLVLNLSLYIGMAASRQAFEWSAPSHSGSVAPFSIAPPAFGEGSSASTTGK